MSDNTNKLKDSDNNSHFDRIVLDKSNLKYFLKNLDESNTQPPNTNINENKIKKIPGLSDSNSQKKFEKKLNDIISKKGQSIDSHNRSKAFYSNKISNCVSASTNSTQTTELEQTKSTKEKLQSTDKRQEAGTHTCNSGLSMTSSIPCNPHTKEYTINKPSIQSDTGNISGHSINPLSSQGNSIQSIQKNLQSNNSPYY